MSRTQTRWQVGSTDHETLQALALGSEFHDLQRGASVLGRR
jgi:hypothetical protein